MHTEESSYEDTGGRAEEVQPRREALEETDPANSLILDFYLQNCEQMNFYWLSCTVLGIVW